MTNQRSLERRRQKGLDAGREVKGRSLGADTTRKEGGDNTNPYGVRDFHGFLLDEKFTGRRHGDNVYQGRWRRYDGLRGPSGLGRWTGRRLLQKLQSWRDPMAGP